MEAEAGAGSVTGVVGPNAQTFSLLALAYGRQRPPAPQLAEAVLNRMIEAGVQPNAASINAVLQVRAAPCPCLWTPPNHPAAAAAAAAGRAYAGKRPASIDDVERILLRWADVRVCHHLRLSPPFRR